MTIFKNLSSEEHEQFRQWAQDNYKAGDEISLLWHPVVRVECWRINNGRSYSRRFRIMGDTELHGLPVGCDYPGYENSLREIYLNTPHDSRDVQVDPACVDDITSEVIATLPDCDVCGAVCTCKPTEADLLVTLQNVIELAVTSRDFEDSEILSLQWLVQQLPKLYGG